MKSNLRNMVIVLFAITLISSSAVGLVYQATLEPIAKAKADKLANAIGEVMPPFEKLDDKLELAVEGGNPFILYVGRNGSEAVGYAVECYTMKGYSGLIRLLVGFTAEGNINKVSVLQHAETPGLGAKIVEAGTPFVTQYEGKNPSTFNMKVKKDGGEVDAITASTITSRAYSEAIGLAYNELMKYINSNK